VPTAEFPSPAPSLLAAGPWNRGEFLAVRTQLDPAGHWPTAPSLHDAINHADNATPSPELLLLAQPRPGLDDQSDIERCRRACPLTRLIVVAGAWCEGELRTGRPPTGAIRLYWHEFPAWWRAGLSALANRCAPPWSYPLTSGNTWCAPPASRVVPDPGVLAIDAPTHAAFEALEQAVKPAGWQCRWEPRHRPERWSNAADIQPAAALWDGAQLDAGERHGLQQFCARLAPAPVIALLDFPRPENVKQAQAAGAAAILGKPYSNAALIAELSRLQTRTR
jgi:hypothetical protein